MLKNLTTNFTLLFCLGFSACGGGGSSDANVTTNSTCLLDGITIQNGDSVVSYQNSSSGFGTNCLSEIRTCSNGLLDGSFAYSSCTVCSAGTVECGGPNDSCYSDATAISNEVAHTPSGKCLSYVDADSTGNGTFKIWVEQAIGSSVKVLNADGSDLWQEKLNNSGRVHLANQWFTIDRNNLNQISNSSGVYINELACPPNIFYDENENGLGGAGDTSDFTNTDMCLYLSKTGVSAALNSDLSTIGVTGVASSSAPESGNGTQNSWFESNHIECVNLGMRLPTFYETDADITCPGGGNADPAWCNELTLEIVPLFAQGLGVPLINAGSFFTATSASFNPGYYKFVSSSYLNSGGFNNKGSGEVTGIACVLPNSLSN